MTLAAALPQPAPAGLARESRRGRRIPRAIAVPAAGVAFGAVLPVVYLVIQAATADTDLVAYLTSSAVLGPTLRSIALAASVTVTTVVLAVPAAVAVSRTDMPGRRVLTVALNLPLVIPSFLGAFALLSAFGPRGIVQGWLEPLGVDRLVDVTGFIGSWAALVLFTFPYVLLPASAALRDMDPSVEDAARSLGQSARGTFRRVVLPQLRPAVLSGALLVVLYTLSDFGVPSIMRYDTLTRVIFQEYESVIDRDLAPVVALVLVAVTFAVVALYVRARGPLDLASRSPGAVRSQRLLHLGAWRWPAAGACSAFAAMGLGVPVLVLAYWALRGLSRGNAAPSSLLEPALNSLGVSGAAAVVAVAAALPVAIAVVRYPGRFSGSLENGVWAGHALPGLVIALAAVFFTIRLVPALYQSLAVLVVVLAAHYLPQALGTAQAALGRINPSVEDAARSLGRTWASTLRTVTVPLLMPGLLAGAALVFLNVMKELPITLLLRPSGFDTLAIVAYQPAVDGFYTKAGIAGLALLAVSSLPMALLAAREWRR